MIRRLLSLAAPALVGLVGLVGCDRTRSPEPAPTSSASTTSPKAAEAFDAGSLAAPQPAPARVVAFGDLHGDLDAAKRVLRLAGAIDARDAWIGKDLVVVHTGDAVDRGDDDRAVLDFLEKVKTEARAAGGQAVLLSGNHEIMNVTFDFRYVTERSFHAFDEHAAHAPPSLSVPAAERGRATAFAPGGPYAKMLADRPIVARVGDSIFVHGGVLPKHVKYGLDRINEATRAWLLGQATEPPKVLMAEDSPTWSRMYSAAPGREECKVLDETLKLLNAKRMVMGHTVQKPGIQPACDAHAWRIDVGMSKFYGGPIQALEIRGDAVRVLDERSAADAGR